MTAVLSAVLALALARPAAALETEKLPVKTTLAGGAGSVEVVSHQALVRFAESADASARASALASVGASIIVDFPSIGWTTVRLPDGMTVAAGLAVLSSLPGVLQVQPDHAYRTDALPSDPNVSTQYALSQINANAAWDLEHGQSNRVTVAVIDSGVLATHPEFNGKIAGPGQAFDPTTGAQTADATVACNHGTRVAGIAAAQANNGQGGAGVSWDARVVSLKVFRNGDCNPTGSCPVTCLTDDTGIIAAVNYAVAQQNTANFGRVVINMSIGGATACPGAVSTALNNAAAAGVPVVISAGNDGGAVNAPANCAGAGAAMTGIIPVGATDSGNNIAGFSSRGAELAAQGVVAPGVNVFTTDLSDSYTTGATGTSFSAPHVAGLAALMLSARTTACNSLACAQNIQTNIRGGADGIGVSSLGSDAGGYGVSGNSSGAGRVNAFNSVRLAVRGTLADFDGRHKVVAFPNPFRVSGTGTMSFAIPPSLQGSGAKIKIYTVAGELVKELSGLAWDGKNEGGHKVASGTYVFFVKTSAGESKGRFAVIR